MYTRICVCVSVQQVQGFHRLDTLPTSHTAITENSMGLVVCASPLVQCIRESMHTWMQTWAVCRQTPWSPVFRDGERGSLTLRPRYCVNIAVSRPAIWVSWYAHLNSAVTVCERVYWNIFLLCFLDLVCFGATYFSRDFGRFRKVCIIYLVIYPWLYFCISVPPNVWL